MNYQHSSTIPGSSERPYFRGGDIPSTIPTNPNPSRSNRIDVETIKIPDFRGQRICPNARSTSFCLTRDLCVMALRCFQDVIRLGQRMSKRTKPAPHFDALTLRISLGGGFKYVLFHPYLGK